MMKQIDLLKLSDATWIRKRQGFRVRSRQLVDDVRVDVLMPSGSELPMDSDVAAWRVAYKLSQAHDVAADGQPVHTSITVVDDLGDPIDCYMTGTKHVFND